MTLTYISYQNSFQYVNRLVELCKSDDMSYINHSLIILEHSIGISKDGNYKLNKRQSPENFFMDNKVLHLIAVECTLKKV
jgi:hypothetical protein